MEINSEQNFNIKNLTSFKIGGEIGEVFFPENIHQFVELLKTYPNIEVFGNLSNTLVSSYGYDGKIIITSKMNRISIYENKVSAGCGVKGPKLAQEVCASGLSGLEFMIGFPGSVGGEVCMNASANGQAISDKLVSVTCFSRKYGLITFSKEKMGFGYRSSRCRNEDITVLQADFELEPKKVEEIQNQMNANLDFRRKHQPSLALPNCGSIFKNPVSNPAGRLLESVGAKQLMIGGAHVWRNHSNFIINANNATSLDVLELMLELKERVLEEYNINLEPEIRFLGSNKEELKLWQKLNKK